VTDSEEVEAIASCGAHQKNIGEGENEIGKIVLLLGTNICTINDAIYRELGC
jgi:hypothetical protein